jgi:hypothetical protein
VHRPAWYLLSCLCIVAALSIAAPASAVDFNGFDCISDNDASDCAIGESQLSATIVASGADALLTLTMTGPDDGVVEQLFIESALVSGISFDSSGGVGVVAFGSGQIGGTLPGGTMVSFLEAFNIMANNPAPRNGIGRHNLDDTSPQSGDFLLSLTGGNFDDLVAELRIGVHVIGYDGDGSESFVSTPLPEPNTLTLIGLGIALASRRRIGSLSGVSEHHRQEIEHEPVRFGGQSA